MALRWFDFKYKLDERLVMPCARVGHLGLVFWFVKSVSKIKYSPERCDYDLKEHKEYKEHEYGGRSNLIIFLNALTNWNVNEFPKN